MDEWNRLTAVTQEGEGGTELKKVKGLSKECVYTHTHTHINTEHSVVMARGEGG